MKPPKSCKGCKFAQYEENIDMGHGCNWTSWYECRLKRNKVVPGAIYREGRKPKWCPVKVDTPDKKVIEMLLLYR